MKIKITAVVIGTVPDEIDPTICGEDIVLSKRDFPNAGLARKWVNEQLVRPLPSDCLSQYGWLRKKEHDRVWGWETVAESDTITVKDYGQPTKWFTD